MALEVTWSPEAVEDLENIVEYIARDSEYYARSVVMKIMATSRSTGEFPLIGRVVPEIGEENIRERIVYNYRLVYRIETGRILIVAVIHGKRLLGNMSGRLEGDM